MLDSEMLENYSRMSKKGKGCRRSKRNRNQTKHFSLMYANIQGARGKITSLRHVMETVSADFVLLAETMTRKVCLDGCEVISPKKSTGQNVSIILSKSCCTRKKMKLFEPNETVNMMGIRIEINQVGFRLYTAHLKQQSTSTREEIQSQFDEIRNQFKSANTAREPMIIAFDANVHVGKEGISKCKDRQDWGGKILMSLIKDEGLTLVNNEDFTKGVVTRVDPRTGSESTIDLVICNTYMHSKVESFVIDESGSLKLRKYGKKITETDHNTMIVQFVVDKPMTNQPKKQQEKKFNLRNVEEKAKMKLLIEADEVFDSLFTDESADLNEEANKFLSNWNRLMEKSFHVVKPSKTIKRRVDGDLKKLLDEEKWVRKNVKENPERGQRIAQLQQCISEKIAENVSNELEEKVNNILHSENPLSKVFKVRRNANHTSSLDFPMKDEHGVVQVSKHAVDQIIANHFKKVFAQNDVPDDDLWKEYWVLIDEVFALLDQKAKQNEEYEEPSFSEIQSIIDELKITKATYGPLTIDLVKLGGIKITKLIHRCILRCIRENKLPDVFREEKMTILLKNNGVIGNINDYRGIFLRCIILSVFQKWLYMKNAEKVDRSGSEYACGGRKNRSGTDALLILKLVQDYSKWTNKQIIFKFLDVEKFFDTMNFKKAMIEAYLCGVTGRHWQCYKTINEKKLCIPCIPSGKCTPIKMSNVFAQGSCDAVLMAWPLMDSDSKRESDLFSNDCCIEGVLLNRLSFIDDLCEITKCGDDTKERNLSNEVFEKKTRMKFKISKCKVMPRKKENMVVILNYEEMEVVGEYVYLGTIVSNNGERTAEMKKRMKDSNSVANEIVQICKETELSIIRLRYVKLLVNACLDSQVKYGCALWNITKSKTVVEDLNKIKPRLVKRVLELPFSTPSAAIQYDFGINDLSLDILMEKVILGAETLSRDDGRISRRLLKPLLEKNVPGFCTQLKEACSIFDVNLSELIEMKDVRKYMKEKVVVMQGKQLLECMLVSSKMDHVLLGGFRYDGKVMKYLQELDFDEARAVFMCRYRMLPSKTNFPGRWKGTACDICGFDDTDLHVFSCPGYQDIEMENVTLNMFWNPETLNNIELISKGAKVMVNIIRRMEEIKGIDELSS